MRIATLPVKGNEAERAPKQRAGKLGAIIRSIQEQAAQKSGHAATNVPSGGVPRTAPFARCREIKEKKSAGKDAQIIGDVVLYGDTFVELGSE